MWAVRATGPIRVDGVLDESAWAGAEPVTDFIQSTPNTGWPATERTEVRILYDDRNLYVGAELYDSEPERITAQYLEQDFETHDDDVFAVTLDTFLDRRNSFMFLVNPNGAVKDGQTFDNSRIINLAWEGVIQVRTTVHSRGWTVELAIPFTTLRFDPDRPVQDWGIQFLRRIRRKNEDDYWAPVDRRTRVHKMALAGTLRGLQGLPRTRNLWVKPYTLAATSSGALLAPGTHGPRYDAGLDLKYGVTPRLTLDLTYRTDFSQVEVDREQVNLTRFSLFFPEKRDFFVENSGTFSFGDQSERNYRLGASPRDFTLFHSRRIGLHQGRPVPIRAGGRLTGRAGGFDLGVLAMWTEETEALPSEAFTVARVSRALGGGLQVGGIFVNRQAPGQGAYNRSYGVDANLRVLDNLIVHSYWAATDYPDRIGRNRAMRLSAAWRDRFWDVSALYREIGDGFDPGVGFVARRGIRHTYATVGVHPRPRLPFVNELNPYAEVHYITNLRSLLETRKGSVGLAVDFLDGGRLTTSFTDRFERLFEPFRVAGEGEVPAGVYAFREGSLAYESSRGRGVSGSVRLSGGGFFDGTRRSVEVGGAWRPNRHLALDLRAQHNRIGLPTRSFSADVFGARLRYAYSTRLFFSAFLQYNASSGEAVSNLRFNFIHAPLSDVFLVLTERRDGLQGRVLERTLTVKATRLVSF